MDIHSIIKNVLGIDPEELMRTVAGFQEFILQRDRWAQEQAKLTREAHFRHEAILQAMCQSIDEIHSVVVTGTSPAGPTECPIDPSINALIVSPPKSGPSPHDRLMGVQYACREPGADYDGVVRN